jgi:hypothetical protein
MTPEETKRWIWSRCTECADCLLWTGATDDNGTPQMRLPGSRKVHPARRVLLEAMGKDVKGRIATTKCDNKACMAEEHVVLWTRKQLQQRNGKKIAGNVARSAKLAAAAQKRSKLTMEDARMIRSTGMTWREVMERFGVSESTAYDVIAGRHFKDYSSPFAGLFAMNDSMKRAA